VTFWLDTHAPVIALSVRYDRIDYFWHTLAHELGHVNLRDGLNEYVTLDVDLVGEDAQPLQDKTGNEKLADSFATEFLISQKELEDFIIRAQPFYGKIRIAGFAQRIKVHPGIVVGQLQHRGRVQWSYYREMLDKIRHIITQAALTDGWGQTPGIPLSV
jgi:HTH-type transcriptional regulator/antitoxin HigA